MLFLLRCISDIFLVVFDVPFFALGLSLHSISIAIESKTDQISTDFSVLRSLEQVTTIFEVNVANRVASGLTPDACH